MGRVLTILTRQRDDLRRRLVECPRESARYGSLQRQIADANDALKRARRQEAARDERAPSRPERV